MKEEIRNIIYMIRKDALKSEEISNKEIEKLRVPKDIIANKQYWNGYLDACNNFEKELKKKT